MIIEAVSTTCLANVLDSTRKWSNLPHDYYIYRKDRLSRDNCVLITVHNSILSRIIDSPTEMELVVIQSLDLNLYFPQLIYLILKTF